MKKMSILSCVRRLDCSLLLMFLMATISLSKTQEDECLYYYITQPSSEANCNPWSYITSQSGNDMVLHCDLLGPQNDDILSVEWYREKFDYEEDSKSSKISLYSSSRAYKKFDSPNSSGDVAHGFKRINFTLFVNEASDDDAGCYWCEVVVQSARDGCFFHLRQSNVFCLERRSEYRGREACSILPVDSSVCCASPYTCNELPLNWNGNPYLLIEEDHQVEELSSLAPTSTHPIPQHTSNLVTHSAAIKVTPSVVLKPQSSQQSSHTVHVTDHHKPTPSWSGGYASTSMESAVTPTDSTSKHTSATSASTIILSAIPSPTSSPITVTDCHPTTDSSTKDNMETGKGANGTGLESSFTQTPLQIGIFIGIGLCAVLFAIISMLVFGVVMLCQKTESRSSRRNNRASITISRPMHLLGQAPALNAVWRADGGTDEPTSVVNRGHVISPTSVPTYTDIPTVVESEDSGNRPIVGQPRASIRRQLNTDGQWKTHSLPVLSDDHRSGFGHRVSQLRHDRHYASLEGERSLRSRSPDLHYYHVLERPEYYNCISLDEDGNDALLPGRRQAGKYHPKEVTIEDDSGSDSEYHWRVVLTSSTREEDQDIMDKSSSSKRVGRHLYRRLDHSTLEPHQDYAKVSIGLSQEDSESGKDEAHA